jgi:ribosomal protein S18 acetylase RimI-like enzyme
MAAGIRDAPQAHQEVAVTEAFAIEPLSPVHDRSGFSCGVPVLDEYLARRAGQEARGHFAKCFVAVASDVPTVAGFYTLSATSVSVSDLPADILRRSPKVPAALIGRLAVDSRFRGRGLGEALLLDAVHRALHSDTAVFAVVVEAKDDAAAAFYRKYEFAPFAGSPQALFLPVGYFDRMKQRQGP